jgi:formate dehydrogenase major subunit
MLKQLLSSWPVVKQITRGGDGTGPEAMSEATRALRPRHDDTHVARSVCPYCGVGCGQLVFHRRGRVVSIEGDPESPISAGRLCPKGAASFELVSHPARATRVKYRPPHATAWQDLDLERAMDMVADRVWEARERHFEERRIAEMEDGSRELPLMQCPSIAHLGGATLDNEENYLINKLFAGGLGMVCISNQARI